MTDRKLKTPFSEILPPLSTEEREALASDIKRHGVRDSVVIDGDGNILDGHNRYSIDPSAPVRVISGLSEDEKRAFVIRANMTRRNLSPTQKTELRRKMQAIAKQLRESDPKKWTQKAVADVLGVAQQTVADWFTTNTGAGNGCTIDARVKLTPDEKQAAVDRVLAGETQEQVAADFGVTQQAVGKHVVQAEIQSRTPAAAANTGNPEWMTPLEYIGMARDVMGSIDTDPATSERANQSIIAHQFHTESDSGLGYEWRGNVWLNPPYSAGLVGEFIEHLIGEIEAGRVKQAIVLVNNATDTHWFRNLIQYAHILCFKTGRIAFVDTNGNQRAGAAQGQVFLYFGSRRAVFAKIFGEIGWVTEVKS